MTDPIIPDMLNRLSKLERDMGHLEETIFREMDIFNEELKELVDRIEMIEQIAGIDPTPYDDENDKE